MISVIKAEDGDVLIVSTLRLSSLRVTKVEYENFLRGVFNGEYDYSLLEEE